MHAALIDSFDRPPHYATIEPPVVKGSDGVIVDVACAGLHVTVRSRAAGLHYTGASLPFVPGIDGVGRLPDGQRVYFVALDPFWGSMAEWTVVSRSHCLVLPDGADDASIAAGMNPAMSSWLPLRLRVPLRPGERVVVLGATGSAGQLAVQIAKHLGASHVVGIGRDTDRLQKLGALGADALVQLTGDTAADREAVEATALDTDVVIDYLWGEPTESVAAGVLQARSDASRPLRWVHIGAVAGPTIVLPGAALRAHNLTLIGSGQGSTSLREIASELPALIDLFASEKLRIEAALAPLSDVEATWNAPLGREKRVVLQP